MTDFSMNSLVDRAQVYDSFVQLISGSDRYRLKSLQAWDPQLEWPHLVRVADDGNFYLNEEVINQQVTLDLRLTSDEVDTANPPTNPRTISYYMYQKNLRNHVEVAVSVVYYAKDSSSNNFLRFNLTFEVETIGMPRVDGEGDVGLSIGGRVLLVDHLGNNVQPTFIRQAS